MESRCCEVQALEEETAAAAILTSQALAQRLQSFLGKKVSVMPGGPPHSHLWMRTLFAYSHTQSYPSGCIQRVSEEGLQGPWGQGRQQL